MSKHPKNIMQLNRLSYAVSIALASLVASNASFAQSASETQAVAQVPAVQNTVIISGTRESIASANARKKNAGTVVDSIVAEDVNQFPDKNVGEAMSRITGVQLSRDFGEGNQVSIRGVEPDLNRIEINGMSVLGTSGGAGRGSDLRELASELIKSIDVFKGSTADMTEGGVGGTVSIKTRKPLDFDKRVIAATVSGEQATSRGGVQPRASLLMADKFFDNRLGLMANLVYDKVLTRNDYARNTSWNFLRDWDFSAEKTTTSIDPAVAAITSSAGCSASTLTTAQKTACNTQWYDYAPRIARYGIWTRDHKRSSAELTAQFKATDKLSFFTSYNGNKQDQILNDRNFGTDFTAVSRLTNAGVAPVYNLATGLQTKAGTCVAVPTTTTPAGVVVTNHYVTQYTAGSCINLAGQGGQGAFATSARRFALNIDSKYASGGLEYRGQDLDIDALLVQSKSHYSSESNSVILTQNAPGLVVTLDAQGLPHFTFPAASNPDNNSSYVQAQLQYRPSETDNTENQLKLDFKYRFDIPVIKKAWFGVQSRTASSTQYNGGGYLASSGSDLVSAADDVNVVGANINQTLIYDPLYMGTAQRVADTQSFINSNFSTKYVNAAQMAALVQAVRENSPGTFFKGYSDVSNMPSGWMSPAYLLAAPLFDTSHFNHANLKFSPGSDGKTYAQIPAFDTDEKIQSAYMRLDFDTSLFGLDVLGNFGGRYTKTHDTSTGSYSYRTRVENSPGSATFTDRVVTNGTTSIDNAYSNFLPSVNASMWLIPDKLTVRAGWAKVMSRPSINLLAPNAICTKNSGLAQFGGDGVDDCSAGNPALKPFMANNTDLSLEYYQGRDTTLSMGLFKKDISSYILANSVQKNVDLFQDGILWDVNQPTNGKGAITKGIELRAATAFTFLPGFLSGLGADVNYTRMGYSYAPGLARVNPLDGSELPYPGLSKNSYNLTLWYDKDKFNSRIAYNYRDRYWGGGYDVTGNPNFIEKSGYLDGKIQYRYNKNIVFSLEGKNLTDQAQISDAGDLFRVNELAFSGRRYFVSVSIKN